MSYCVLVRQGAKLDKNLNFPVVEDMIVSKRLSMENNHPIFSLPVPNNDNYQVFTYNERKC